MRSFYYGDPTLRFSKFYFLRQDVLGAHIEDNRTSVMFRVSNRVYAVTMLHRMIGNSIADRAKIADTLVYPILLYNIAAESHCARSPLL